MNINEQKKIISEEMKKWVSVDTWHTLHPSDIERFNKGLKKCFERTNRAISEEVFEEAIFGMLKENERKQLKEEGSILKEHFQYYIDAVSHISDYYFDNKLY